MSDLENQLFTAVDTLARHGAAIAIGMAARDVLATSVATMRARIALRRLIELSGTATTGIAAELRAVVAQAISDHERLLAVAPVVASSGDGNRILRWIAQSDPTEIDLFETYVRDRHLGMLGFERLRVIRCSFIEASLAGAGFDGAVLEGCDFSSTNLVRTSWRGARVTGCTFANASLVDSTLDEARFVDCSFRGVDLGAAKLGARVTSRRTEFVRCDFRESGWQERILAGTKFDACRFSGIHGRPLLEGVEIESPDLSVSGDRSRIGTSRDVLAAWYGLGFAHWPN